VKLAATVLKSSGQRPAPTAPPGKRVRLDGRWLDQWDSERLMDMIDQGVALGDVAQTFRHLRSLHGDEPNDGDRGAPDLGTLHIGSGLGTVVSFR
jgi:hypothetical protein